MAGAPRNLAKGEFRTLQQHEPYDLSLQGTVPAAGVQNPRAELLQGEFGRTLIC